MYQEWLHSRERIVASGQQAAMARIDGAEVLAVNAMKACSRIPCFPLDSSPPSAACTDAEPSRQFMGLTAHPRVIFCRRRLALGTVPESWQGI